MKTSSNDFGVETVENQSLIIFRQYLEKEILNIFNYTNLTLNSGSVPY